MSTYWFAWAAVVVAAGVAAMRAACAVVERADAALAEITTEHDTPAEPTPVEHGPFCEGCETLREQARIRIRAKLAERARIEWSDVDESAFRQECGS